MVPRWLAKVTIFLWVAAFSAGSARAVANVRQFLVDYGILPEAQVPPVEQFYSLQFLPQSQ